MGSSKQFCVLTTAEFRPVNFNLAPSLLGRCSFKGDDYVFMVNTLLLYLLWMGVLCPFYYGNHSVGQVRTGCFTSSVFLLMCVCLSIVSLPRGAMGCL